MVIQLIEAYPKSKRIPADDSSHILLIAEHFMDTIQGENFVGVPSAFLRMQYCTLNCSWCDTAEVWRKGNPYTVKELLTLWKQYGLVERFKKGHHLILTGGSPVKQQQGLTRLLQIFEDTYHFIPFVEVENECTLMPTPEFSKYVKLWNNSPKLENSGMKKEWRIKPDVLKYLTAQNSYYKFVITGEQDWSEIKQDYLDPGYIRKDQIVLMPEGMTREQLQQHYQIVIDMACREGLRMTDRTHITIWNKKTGV